MLLGLTNFERVPTFVFMCKKIGPFNFKIFFNFKSTSLLVFNKKYFLKPKPIEIFLKLRLFDIVG